MTKKEALLKKLIELPILTKGEFVLKSGLKANRYLDVKRALGQPEILNNIVECFLELYPLNQESFVVGAGYGGLPLAVALSIRTGLPLTMIREGKREHGLLKQIEGYFPKKDEVGIGIDDVLTRGTNLEFIADVLKPINARLSKYLVVVERGVNTDFIVPVYSLFHLKDLLNE